MKSQPAEVDPVSHHEIAISASWETRLQEAIGNDAELLALAIEAQSIEHKLSAVQALASEEGLRAAEREFRKHDRRVHTLAKQRFESQVKQRETRASATELIQSAADLLEAPTIPANRLAELSQAWELLDATLIQDEHKVRFAALQADLAGLMRERGEHKRAFDRWSTTAKRALGELNSACAFVAEAGIGVEELSVRLAAARENARVTLEEMALSISSTNSPQDSATAQLGAAIQTALQESALISDKLEILGDMQASSTLHSAALYDETSPQPYETFASAAFEHWQGMPSSVAPNIEDALKTRFDLILRLHDEALKKLQKHRNLVLREKDKEALQLRVKALMVEAEAMEVALAAGNLAEAGKHSAILQTGVDKGGLGATLLSRIGALQSEFLRLKDWQHWGGGRVREDLVLEAEALAASTVAQEESKPVKLPIKQLENGIEQLRTRWKELDRLGGATSKTLWMRFDGALKTAYLPVAAHLEQLNKARKENLAARKKLLAVLDGLSITVDGGAAPDWKVLGRALDHFKTEWRKLGPVEHTVPHKSQPEMLEHLKASLARLEGPLSEMQVGAQFEREQLIVRARALSQDVQGREMVAKIRELQSKWQSHAKSHPLPRKTENQLWTEFKAVIDTLMSQRQAALNARDAEFKANQTVREALIAKLEVLHQDTPPDDIKRILASVDAEWRKAGEAPKNQADKLESRYRLAREHAHQHLAGSARRTWQLTCDTLYAKLALCEELESATPSADIKARWESLPPLPHDWEQALQARYRHSTENQGVDNPVNRVEPIDQLLLHLESSLEIPSPEVFQKARQTLKLLAMKNALEGRRLTATNQPDIEKMTTDALGSSGLSPEQRGRLHSILQHLRSIHPAVPGRVR